MPTQAQTPIPTYPSSRLVGLELEYDSGNTEFREPRIPSGWVRKGDGSLRNGYEFVLEPAVPLNRAAGVIKAFCDACNEARINIGKRGGYHIHVQGHNYDRNHDDSYNLVKLYTHFQHLINQLVGKSRVGNSFCQPYRSTVTRSEMVGMFQLDRPASSRNEAKGSRAYSVVNLAMMRVDRANERSIEFRQGSSSKRFECVWGWACLMVALVDMAQDPVIMEDAIMQQRTQPTLDQFIELLRSHQEAIGASNVAEWVKWRHDYMNAEPTEALIGQALALMGTSPRGLFHISRQLDVNLALATKIMDAAVQQGLVTAVPSGGGYGDQTKKWKASYEAWAARDLTELEAAETARNEAVAQALARPQAPAPAQEGSVQEAPAPVTPGPGPAAGIRPPLNLPGLSRRNAPAPLPVPQRPEVVQENGVTG